MNFRRSTLAILLVAFSLACNFITRAFTGPAPASPAPTPGLPTPIYFPQECQNIPLATVPAATALAQPTPVLQANPEISQDIQQQVFEKIVGTVRDVYVYPDFNGKDWPGIAAKYRARIQSGLDTKAFYSAMQSMIEELGDEHSSYESPVEVAISEAELAGSNEFVGIGAYMLPMTGKGYVSLISVYPNSPAERSGLKPHDSLLLVDRLPIVENDEVYIHRVRGPECSAAVLTVQSPGEAPREIMVVRRRIQSPSVVETHLLPTSDGSRIGYIFLPTFFDETIPGQVADALESFGTLDGLILDNRLNGGGSSNVLEPALAFFTSGALGQYASRSESRPLTIDPNPIQNSQTVPLVVLVSEETASFGEIFAGVLKDSGRALIVGQPTLGNVEVLHGYDLQDGSRLWIAQETFTPANSHADWETTGIIPDVEAYADWDTFTFETDPSIAAALVFLGR